MTRPTREEFARLWHDPAVTVEAICRRYRVSNTTCVRWAKRWGLAPRTTGGYRPPSVAPPIMLKREDDHCHEVHDGPGPGDPTPADIDARAWAIRQRHLEEKRTSQA